MNQSSNSSSHKNPRQERFISHALVDVRKFRNLPFFCYSAVLLDVSLSGYKLEFTSEIQVSPGDQFWLSIPLSPLGINAPKRFVGRAECKWFDPQKYRMGGVFTTLEKSQEQILSQVVEVLQAKGNF